MLSRTTFALPFEPVTDRPYHHGNLRETLLEQAVTTLRTDGLAALSLRELARQAGVSHAAPRRHFADRQALLDALALHGFAQLGAELTAATEAAGSGDDLAVQMRALARAYIEFASRDAVLLELMFSSKYGTRLDLFEEAADQAFAPVHAAIARAQQAGLLPEGDPKRAGLSHLATIQGIASLRRAGVVGPDGVDDLIEDAVAMSLAGARAQTISR
jgi:AcrR family transcriptional regulator